MHTVGSKSIQSLLVFLAKSTYIIHEWVDFRLVEISQMTLIVISSINYTNRKNIIKKKYYYLLISKDIPQNAIYKKKKSQLTKRIAL